MTKINENGELSVEEMEKLQNMIDATENDPADIDPVDAEELERLIKNANVE